MHFDLACYLQDLAHTHPGDSLGYLWEFGPVYAWWCLERGRDAQPIGFLAFNRLIIRSFRQTFPGQWIPVQPSSLLPYPAALRAQAAAVSEVAELQAFSSDLERWHHGVHHAVGGRDGDCDTLLFMRWFWEFRIFLDSQLALALEAWGLDWSGFLSATSDGERRTI